MLPDETIFPLFYIISDSNGIQMRNRLRLKIRIFDLEGLRCFESKKNLSKSCRKSPNLKLFKAKLFYLSILIREISKILTTQGAVGMKLLRIIKWKNFAFRSFRFRLFLQLLLQKFFDSKHLRPSRSKIRIFRRSVFLIWMPLEKWRGCWNVYFTSW